MTKYANFSAPTLKECVVLGCSGFPFSPGDQVRVAFDEHGVSLQGAQRAAGFSYVELAELAIAGPGSVTSGGGFIGGGFGIEGALEGMAIATVLNVLSAKTKIHTFITIVANFGEIHFHYGDMEPRALRVALAGVFVRLRQTNPEWLIARKKVIEGRLSAGAISAEEFESLLARLSTPPDWPDPVAQRQMEEALAQAALDSGPKGICPNCRKVIALRSESCKHCKAAFGPGSAWVVTPQ